MQILQGKRWMLPLGIGDNTNMASNSSQMAIIACNSRRSMKPHQIIAIYTLELHLGILSNT